MPPEKRHSINMAHFPVNRCHTSYCYIYPQPLASLTQKEKRTLEALQNLDAYKLNKGAIFDLPSGIPRAIFDPPIGYLGEILIP
jgi:hypothetical protein